MREKTIWILSAILMMAVAGCGGSSGDQVATKGASFVVLQAEGEYISGFVFSDINTNDVMDTCEPGIEGVKVELQDSEGASVYSSSTDNSGYYILPVSTEGYKVVETDPAGYYSVSNEVFLADVLDMTVNFADRTIDPGYSICGTVFEDKDGNGERDEAETGMGGVTVTLSGDGDTVTNTFGIYAFAVTVASSYSYTVTAIEPEGYLSTTPNPVEVTVSYSDTTQDFGLRRFVEVPVDVKPGSCVNPVNLKSSGVLPVAVLGSQEFDVSAIIPETILLNGVAPLRSNIGDVCGDEECGEGELLDDDYPDLLLKFETQEIANILMVMYPELSRGEIVTLDVEGELVDQTAIVADPPVRILIVQVPKE